MIFQMYFGAESEKMRQARRMAGPTHSNCPLWRYADLFVEICPPIPTEHKDRFSINGQLMQGYMVATKEPERPDQGQVDALLDCLDDADMLEVPTLAPKKQHPQKENHTIKKKYSPTR